MIFVVPDPQQAGASMGFRPGKIFGLYPAALSIGQLMQQVKWFNAAAQCPDELVPSEAYIDGVAAWVFSCLARGSGV